MHLEAGVTLTDLDAALRNAGRYYPPTPTFMGAFVGGTIATNAAGAATFKYGSTRDWVQAITVVLPSGDVLDIERGQVTSTPTATSRSSRIEGRRCACQSPRYRLPQVAKLAAGYFAASEMDLIDLFIGSEGTLGVIMEATLRVLPVRPAMCLALVPFAARLSALAFVRQLRGLARDTWRTKDPHGIDVSAIEHMDARCLELLREDGVDVANGVTIPAGSEMALLVTLELPADTTADHAFEEIGSARETTGSDGPLRRFCRLLDAAGVLDDVEVAVPGDVARAAQLLAVREAVPAAVNQRVGRAKQALDARIEKDGGRHDRPFRSSRGTPDDLRNRLRHARARRGDLGTHLRRQPSSERHPPLARRREGRQDGDSRIRPRGHTARRRAARRTRRRAKHRQTAAARDALRKEGRRGDAGGESGDRSRVEARARSAVPATLIVEV